LDGKRIVVAIDQWKANHRYPSGHWVHVLGNVNDPDVEAKVILNEFDVTARCFSIKKHKRKNHNTRFILMFLK
jgi:exosome complex exonuclease DIS3/RRP44